MNEKGGKVYHLPAKYAGRWQNAPGHTPKTPTSSTPELSLVQGEDDPIFAAAAALANKNFVCLNFLPEDQSLERLYKILDTGLGSVAIEQVRSEHPIIDQRYEEVILRCRQILREEIGRANG